MSKVKASAFFCEDIRFEKSEQPMFIGVCSPVLEVEDLPFVAGNLIFVTMFIVDPSLDSFEATLYIDAENASDEDKNEFPLKVSKNFVRPEDARIDCDWMVLSYYDLSHITFLDKLSLSSRLVAIDYDETLTLQIMNHNKI